jgi:DNA-binding transcriptional MerR regulator
MTAPPSNPPTIPDKLYFRIGEVSRIAGVPATVLRFWQSQFVRIKPKRTEAGQRLYRKQDVELILTIKHLLYDQKFTIEGARNYLKSRTRAAALKSTPLTLQQIRMELKQIKDLLK